MNYVWSQSKLGCNANPSFSVNGEISLFLWSIHMKINRTSHIDAQKLINQFVPCSQSLNMILDFFAASIQYANSINPANWNINVDKNGRFIRLNVGQEYCLTVSNKHMLVLGQRNLISNHQNITFLSYSSQHEIIESKTPNMLPDILMKVPGSIGCLINHVDISISLPSLLIPNLQFISYAIRHTKILPQSKKAHSAGFIDFLSEQQNTPIPNPTYYMNEIAKSVKIAVCQNNQISQFSKDLSLQELKAQVNQHISKTNIKTSTISRYVRSQYIKEYALKIANGICHDCGNPAPFLKKNSKEPYLETHHIIPLSKGGKDEISNVIALCPNCHRKKHYA